MNKTEFDPKFHQDQHGAMHCALKVHIERDSAGNALSFADEGEFNYNLFRGSAYGEGHSDRLLDDYLNRKLLDADLKSKCSCNEYTKFLRQEKLCHHNLPPLCLRLRLLKSV